MVAFPTPRIVFKGKDPSFAQTFYRFSKPEARPYVVVGLDPEHADFGPFTPGTQTLGIQEAINYIENTGGGTVLIRKGTYNPQSQIVINKSNIKIRGEGRGITVIQPASNITYNIPFNPLFSIGIDLNQNVYGGLNDIEVSDMTIYPSPIGSTSTVTYIAIGGILPTNSHFHDLEFIGTTHSAIGLLFGFDPTGVTENVVMEKIWDTNSHPIGVTNAFPGVSNAYSGSSSYNNLRNLIIRDIFSKTTMSLGDDKISLAGGGDGNWMEDISISNVHIYISPTGQGVNGIKLDPGTGCSFRNLHIEGLWFINDGPFLSNATLPLALNETNTTSSTVFSIENVVVEDVYTYNANAISVFAPLQQNNGYKYPNPFGIYRNIYVWETQSLPINAILQYSPNASPSNTLESLLIDGLYINGWDNTGGALTPLGIEASSSITFNGVIRLRNVYIINMGSYGGAWPPFFVSNVTFTNPPKIENAFGVNYPMASPTISANPPASGTPYQNTNGYDIELIIPITLNPTSTAAATATLQIGPSSTSLSTVDTETAPAGLTAGFVKALKARIPAGWYYQLTLTNATAGTATVLPA